MTDTPNLQEGWVLDYLIGPAKNGKLKGYYLAHASMKLRVKTNSSDYVERDEVFVTGNSEEEVLSKIKTYIENRKGFKFARGY